MTNVDQFESVFRSADKTPFVYERVEIGSVLIITDFEAEYEAMLWQEQVRTFLAALTPEPTWTLALRDESRTVRDVLDLVESTRPDLICIYRHLHTQGWKWPFTLGDHVEVLTQATSTPVMVLPHPSLPPDERHPMKNTAEVMAMTDHLTGDHRLINFAAAMTANDGKLFLAHVEDEIVFARYIEVISRIPTIDTEHARQVVHDQLLKEPRDYIDRCREGLRDAGIGVEVEACVSTGRYLEGYQALIDEHEVDLLVINTKDDDQLAMHGLAYPLAIELRHIPLLML